MRIRTKMHYIRACGFAVSGQCYQKVLNTAPREQRAMPQAVEGLEADININVHISMHLVSYRVTIVLKQQ